jgi:hypothetical protein
VRLLGLRNAQGAGRGASNKLYARVNVWPLQYHPTPILQTRAREAVGGELSWEEETTFELDRGARRIVVQLYQSRLLPAPPPGRPSAAAAAHLQLLPQRQRLRRDRRGNHCSCKGGRRGEQQGHRRRSRRHARAAPAGSACRAQQARHNARLSLAWPAAAQVTARRAAGRLAATRTGFETAAVRIVSV